MVAIHPNYPDQKVQIGKEMQLGLRQEVIEFLTSHLENFTWCTQDIKWIHPSIAEHRLNIDLDHRAIKQKLRQFGEDKIQGMRDEVRKLLQANSIREVEYPFWLANVVMVKNLSGKWRMCIYYTYLNKACPRTAIPYHAFMHW